MTSAQSLALQRLSDRVRAPLAWLHADHAPVAFRACYLCAHGADAGIERVCTHPALQHMATPQPVAVLRAWGGGCGPDADRMTTTNTTEAS